MNDRAYETHPLRAVAFILVAALALALAGCPRPAIAHDPKVTASFLTAAACSARTSPYAVWVVNASASGNCTTTGGGTSQVHCCCADETWAECGGGGVSDHGALTGLTDDDHTQYPLLLGRSGGQTLIGGTGTLDELNLHATSGTAANGALFLGGSSACLFADHTFTDLSSACSSTTGTAISLDTGDAFTVNTAGGQIAQMTTAGSLFMDGILGLGSDVAASAACVGNNGADRLWHDTDCDGVKDAGEGFINGYDEIRDNGVAETQRRALDLYGSPVSCADYFDGSETVTRCTFTSGAALTVEEVDTSPSVASVDKISFDQADGFVVTDSGSGDVRIDFSAAQHAGHLSAIQTYTTGSGTYTVPAGVTRLVVQGVGGGAGGGNGSSNTTNCGAGGGGGAGGYFEVTLSSLSSSYSYAVGAGGGSAANGSNTTFGSYTANGGTAGASCNICSVSGAAAGGAGGAASGTSAIASYGQSGSAGMCLDVSTGIMCIGGTGGSSELGDGAVGYAVSTTGSGAGSTASGEGGGGGGGCGTNTSATNAGGSGATGVIRIYEYSDEDAVVTSGFAPYGEYDVNKSPAVFYLSDEYSNDTSTLTYSWGNQDSATVANAYDGLLLDGVNTAEYHAYGINQATHTMPTNSDQTFCASVAMTFDGINTDGCGIGVLDGGTMASPTAQSMLVYSEVSTDSIYFFDDSDFVPAGATTVDSKAFNADSAVANRWIMRLSYVDSTRVTTASWSHDGKNWEQFGSTTTLGADPVTWFLVARESAQCHFDWIRLFSTANANCGSR